MSKKTPSADAAKPVEIPNPESAPAVVEARTRHNALAEKLAGIRRERKNLEDHLGAKPGESDDSLEARMMARGLSTDQFSRLRELRRAEQVTAKAVDLVAEDLKEVRTQATREASASAREQVFLPAVRAAVKDWLEAVKKAEEFRSLVGDLQSRGVGANTYCPFNERVPLTLADQAGFVAFVAELISDGFTDRETVSAAFPGLI